MDVSESLIPDDSGSTPALEPIAMVALDAGRMLMEAGASAVSIDTIVTKFARGLGADRVDLRIGYASLAITIGIGANGITRMRKVGHLGVNQRQDLELWHLSDRVETKQLTVEQTRAELDRIATKTKRHSAWVMAVAVGLACAAFGRLLKVDWAGTGPVFLAATIGQYVRRDLLSRHANVFVCATAVAFLSAVLAGLGAQWAGSVTVMTAMIASILLLVPGIPSVNAQNDILEGHPTLGSARAVTVAVILIFVAAGLGFAQMLVGVPGTEIPNAALYLPPFLSHMVAGLLAFFGYSGDAGAPLFLFHQTVCGAIAAAGFGVLFNISFRSLAWCALSGGLALAVRTYCLNHGLNLEGSSFAAALTVSSFVMVLRKHTDVSQNALDVVGCIPMVPGSFAAKAILGLFALTSTDAAHATETLTVAVQYTLRVMFTIGAIGTGLAIPTLLQRVRVSR